VKTTQDSVGVGPGTLGEMLTEEVRKQRASLPHAPNGSPKAPSDPYVAQVLKDWGQGKALVFPRLHAVLRCNLKDGVPIAVVTRELYLLIADLEAEAELISSAEKQRALGPLMRLETKRQCDVRCAEIAVLERPDDVSANRALLDAIDRDLPMLAEIRERAEVAVVQGSPRRVIGARRAKLQLQA
jgi:hypothetical protein